MPEQPELTIQGWGPSGPRLAPLENTDPDDGGLARSADPDLAPLMPKAARRHLGRELGWTPRATPPVPVSEIRLPPSRLPADVRSALTGLLGEDNVHTDAGSRLRRAGGKSYLDLLRRRGGDASDAPDAVVLPGSTEETAGLLSACSGLGVVVVPFGGGTSVVGGLAGVDPDDRPSVAVDLRRMASVQAVDVPSSLVTVGPGMRGPALEEALAGEGLTLGHLPQSWEFATVGGYAATRSAGMRRQGSAGSTTSSPG